MAKPFDATMRELFELSPAAWLEFLGIPVPDPNQVQVIDSNVSTITAEADKVVRVGGKNPFIIHAEFLSGRNLAQPELAHWYNTVLSRKHQVPVWTVVVLLRPAADGPELTGVHEREFPGRGTNLWFRHDVVRIWLEPPERVLTCGLPVLPLAPVSNVTPERLPEVLAAVARRLRDEATPDLKSLLWSSTTVLMGLYHPKEYVYKVIKEPMTMILGIPGIEESTVYQDIFAKGRAEEAREVLILQGGKRFGPPDERVRNQITSLTDLVRLTHLLERILDISTWDELLAPEESQGAGGA